MTANTTEDIIVSFVGKSIKVDGRKEAKQINKKLKDVPNMTTFELSGNTVGIDGAAAIAANLATHKDLKRCMFSDMFTGRMVDEIAPALRHLSTGILQSGAQLTELDLSDNAFGPRGVIGITDLISSSACYSLKVLKMNNQGLGHQGARHLAEALDKGITESCGKGLKLEVFSAGRNRLENVGAILLADVFTKMGSLQELHLYQNGIGIHGLEGIEALAGAISENVNMRILNLSDNNLVADGGKKIAGILPYLHKLKELILDDCLIRSEGCRALAKELERDDVVPNLTSLCLYGNEIRSKDGIRLALSLTTKASTLQHINLDGNEFGPTGIDTLIRTLDSVNLLSAIAVNKNEEEDEGEEEEDDGLDVYHRAFIEDQGEDGDNIDDYDKEEEGYDDEDEYYEEDEREEYEDDEECSSFQENQDVSGSSFNTIKERPVRPIQVSGHTSASQTSTAGLEGSFSFLSCLSEIQKVDNLQPQFPPKSSLFLGLDATDASACRTKMWGSQSSTGVSSLFSPPRLGQSPAVKSPLGGLFATPPRTDSNFNEATAMQSLRNCLSAPEDDRLLKTLTDVLPANGMWNVSSEKLASLSAVSPEVMVRVAFRLARQPKMKPAVESQQDLSERLILAACTLPSSPDASFVSPSSRAVNRVLLHLGAIKPDRGESVERRVAAESVSFMQQDVDLLDGLLKRRGGQLSSSVRQSLSFLLNQHKQEHPNVPLDDLLNQLNSLSVV